MELFINISRGLLGIVVLIVIAWLFSKDRKSISWRLVLSGLGLQVILGFLLIKVEVVRTAFRFVADRFVDVVSLTEKGTSFVFGTLGVTQSGDSGIGTIFAFQILPVIIFFSALTSALYYLGILQKIVKGFAWLMSKTMRLSGAESISAAGNVFLGQTEAPLLVKPYIAGMTRSELVCLMVGGMATIAGSVLAAFVSMLGDDYAAHLLTASLMNAPAAIVIAKILMPETQYDLINTDLSVSSEKIGANFIDAISNGTSEGLKLALNVGAMLIAFIALIGLVNWLLSELGEVTQLNNVIASSTRIYDAAGEPLRDVGGKVISAFDGLSLQYLLGQMFRFIAFAIGIDWQDTLIVGSLLGTKVAVNEFIAYSDLTNLANGAISGRSKLISAYALCGFGNFSSIAIQIAGIGGIAPSQRINISRFGILAVLGGTIACLLTASVAGMFN